MEPLIIVNKIIINAPSNKVWDALVNPEKTKIYMFGCETVSDWQKGSTLLWRGNYEGKDPSTGLSASMIFVKGHIADITPGKYLSYTVIDPHNPNIPDIPENYLTVTYALVEHNGQTSLTVTQGDYNKVAEGEKRYKESYNDGIGWDPVMQAIKKLVEGN